MAEVIENPLSGERITILKTAAETGGRFLAFELALRAGGHVPSSHVHPEQQESFTVLDGTMKFRVGLRSKTVRRGQTVTVPPGCVHHFANAGPAAARMVVVARPALNMEEMLTQAAALAQEDFVARRRFPRALELALFLERFKHEVRVPYLPAGVTRALLGPLTRLAVRRGRDTRYRAGL